VPAVLNLGLLSAISVVPAVWFFYPASADVAVFSTLLAVFIALWLLVWWGRSGADPYGSMPLLADDRQGSMRELRLDAKTAIFDGSNVYHFGHDHGLDAHRSS
jgi:hypothetical protein